MRRILAALAVVSCLTIGSTRLSADRASADAAAAADLAYRAGKDILEWAGVGSVSQRSPQQIEEAIACFERALSFNPDHVASLNSLGHCHLRLIMLASPYGPRTVDPATSPYHVNAALLSWKRYLEIGPPTSSICYLIGWLHYNRGDYVQTAHYWERAAKMKGAPPVLDPYELVELYEVRLKDLGKAEAVLRADLRRQQAAAKPGLQWEAEQRLAGFLLRHGRTEEGLAFYRRRAERTPTTWSFAEMGRVLEYAGRPAQALIWYYRAQERNPPFDKYLAEAIARARAKLGPQRGGEAAPPP
jgi:tetratricopeptide (TPR) repeat protein